VKRNKYSLTNVQSETLECIRRLISCRGIPPTYQEIADELGISANATRDRISWIIKKGYLTQRPGLSRSIHITKPKERKYLSVQAGGSRYGQ